VKARTPIGEIDLGDAGSFVLIFDPAEGRPVYHKRVPCSTSDAGIAERSSCGMTRSVVSSWSGSARTLVLEHRHARRFARPCLRCWPELRTGQLELKAGPLT
jgi:hypothetical protein